MINILRADESLESFLLFSALAPDIHDQLSSWFLELSWIFRPLVLGIDINDHCFAKSSFANWAVNDKFMHSWWQVMGVHEHIAVILP